MDDGDDTQPPRAQRARLTRPNLEAPRIQAESVRARIPARSVSAFSRGGTESVILPAPRRAPPTLPLRPPRSTLEQHRVLRFLAFAVEVFIVFLTLFVGVPQLGSIAGGLSDLYARYLAPLTHSSSVPRY